MDYYFVEKNVDEKGFHRIHRGGCPKCPDDEHRIYIGYFSGCQPAVEKARNFFRQVSVCVECSPEYLISNK